MDSFRLSDDSSQSDTEHPPFSENEQIYNDSFDDHFSNNRRLSDYGDREHHDNNDDEEEDDENDNEDSDLHSSMQKTSDIDECLVEKIGHSEDDSSQSEPEHRPSFGENTAMFNESLDDCFNRKRHHNEVDNDIHEEDEISFEPPAKKTSDIGKRLMQKMGYSEGTGLGKHGQGRLQPVEASNQKGRRGFGHDNVKLKEAKLKWDANAEIVSVQEDMIWLSSNQEVPSKDELHGWIALGPSKKTIDDENLFCSEYIVQQVVNSKSIFDNLDKHEMKRARTRSNPFETIRGVFFQNRAAVKMANLDRACNFMFTDSNIFNPHEPLFFADVCAGPGGFSEYVLWRKRWNAKGFGFTLKETNDFKLDEFYAGSPETFHPFYGPKDDGNVYDPVNQITFQRLIMSQTQGRGVHFMMSDGGFSVEGNESIQEILSKQLYLCQCLVALMIVREGGHFVTKLFDIFTPFSAGLVYLMHRCFKRVCIFKPNTSRPANSERYLICEEKVANVDDVINHLFHANKLLLKKDKDRDVMELVPYEVLRADENFYQYLKESNESLGRKQVVGLLKIAAYCEDTTLIEHRQSQMRKECLEYWGLNDQSRTAPRNMRAEDRLQQIFGSTIQSILDKPPKLLTMENTDYILNTPCDWYCIPSVYNKSLDVQHAPTFYFGMGRTKVYRFIKGSWEPVIGVELPPDTFVYAEMVTEYRGQHKVQRKVNALHIIDAWLLGAEDIRYKYLRDRQMSINKFCNALWKPENNSCHRVRLKKLYSLHEDLTEQLKLEPRVMKNGSKAWAYYPAEPPYAQSLDKNEEPYFIIPRSIIFLRRTMPPWSLYLSRKSGFHYFFNSKTSKTEYDKRRPESAVADFYHTIEMRAILEWSEDQENSIQLLNNKIKIKCPSLSDW